MYAKLKWLLALLFCFLILSVSMAAENDLNFQWVLPPEYYRGNDFHNGRAWVQEEKDGPWTLFDTEGNIIKKGFIASEIWQYRSSDTKFIIVDKDTYIWEGMFGFMDISGDILSAPKQYETHGVYQDGIAPQKGENGLLGFVDYEGNWLILPIYENCILWEDGLMPVKKDGKWGYINKNGDVVIDFRFEEDVFLFKNGLSVASKNSLYGLIDHKGNWLTEPIYERFFYPWSHLVAAQKDGKIGYLDAKGNVVIDFKFTGVDGTGVQLGPIIVFNEERAIVPISKEKEGIEAIYKFAVINESGDIIPTEQDDFITTYNEGFAMAVQGKNLFMIDKNGKNYSLPPDFKQDIVEVFQPRSGIYRVHFKNTDKTGYFKVEK